MPTRGRQLAIRGRFALTLVGALAALLVLPALASASNYVVNTLGDSYSPYGCEDFDECTLRTAISKANEDEDLDTIEFEVEGTIELEPETLPAIIHPLEINATTLPEYKGQPLVELDGTNAFTEGATEGLAFLNGSGGSSVEGLAIGGFEYGVILAGETSIHLCASYIGVGLDGVTAFPNTVGVDTGGGSSAQKIGSECWSNGGNLVSANSQYGIVDFGTGTKIAQNTIGLDANGDPLPNGTAFGAGILVSSVAEEPYIGGFPGEEGEPGNVIAANAGTGIIVEDAASHASIRRNRIYANTEASIEIVNGTPPQAPLVEFSKIEGGATEAFGAVHGEPDTQYAIDVFASAGCYANSVGQGEFFLGATLVTTDSSGDGIFDSDELAVPAVGREYFTTTSTDLATGTTSEIGLCVDQPPSTEITVSPSNPTSSTGASFQFTGSDFNGSVAEYQCSLDGAGFATCVSPKTYSGLADGEHTFEVRAVDQVGTPDFTPTTYEWTVDTTAPTVSIQSGPNSPSNQTAAAFGFSATDPGGSGIATVECSLDGAPLTACTSPASYSSLADGVHTFEVVATDIAGNVENANASWTVDATAPTTAIESKPTDPSAEAEPTIGFSGSDGTGTGVAGYECKLDSGSFEACSSPAALGELEDGPHSFEVRAKDNAGNADASPEVYAWEVNTTAPTTTIETKPANPSKDASPSFAFSGSDEGGSGVARFECSLDGKAFADCASPKAFTGLADGSHSFEVQAVDNAGNVELAPASYKWAIDTSVPFSAAVLQTTTVPTPENGESVAVAPEGGKVYVQRPGQKKPTELQEGQTIPVGSIVDATNGKVLLTSVNAAGEAQSAYFFGGKFLIQQHDGSGLVILKLRGGDFGSCGGQARKSGATASGRKGRRLWGSGHGNFRTEGSYGSATVRGTIWLTEDRCGSTFFKVRRGVVAVRDFPKDRTISLPAGKSYLAQP